jgi:EmrB/QacA subfamily drug resistance transporter
MKDDLVAEASVSHQLQGTRAWFALVSICLGALIGSMAATMFSIAYPALRQGFGIGYDTLMWVNVVYFVVFTVGMPICGALGDRIGHTRTYVLGIGLFAFASLCEALSWNFSSLVAFQFLEGLAGAFMLPSQMALIRSFFRDRQGWAYGYWIMAGSAGALLGPVVGGSLVEFLGWRSIFGFDALLLLLAFLLAWIIMLPRSPAVTNSPLDIVGGLTLLLGGGALQVWLKVGLDLGLTSSYSLSLIAITCIGFALFVWQERRVTWPLVPLGLFRYSTFTLATIGSLLLMTATFGVAFFVPSYLQDVQLFNPVVAGAVVMAEAIALVLLAPLLGKAADRFPTLLPAILGCVIFAAGIALLMLAQRGIPLYILVASMAIEGIGQGLAFPALNKLATRDLPEDQLGRGLGIYNMGRYIGGAFAGAIFGPFLDQSFHLLEQIMPSSAARLIAFQHLFLAIILFATGAGIICFFLFWGTKLTTVVSKLRRKTHERLVVERISRKGH